MVRIIKSTLTEYEKKMPAFQWGFFLIVLFSTELSGHGVSGATSDFWIERSVDYLTYLGSFAFSNHGHVILNISNFHIYSPEHAPQPKLQNVGFFLINAYDFKSIEIDQYKRNTCILYDDSVHVLYNFSQPLNKSIGSNHSLIERKSPGTGEHILFFANCENSYIISANIKATFFNRFLGKKSYGCSGTEPLGTIEFLFSTAYAILFYLWIRHGLKVWLQSPPSSLHLLLTLVVLSSTILYLSFGIQSSIIQASGLDYGWDFISLSLLLLHSATLLSLFFFGLDRMDPYISEVERGILYITVPVFTLSNVILTCISGPISHSEWKTCIQFTISILNRLVILSWILLLSLLFFVLVIWMFSQRSAMDRRNNLTRMTKDDRNSESLFQKFYVLIALSIVASLGVFKILIQLLPYWLAWFAYFTLDLSFFSILTYSLYRFRPRLEKSVYELFDEEESLEELDDASEL